MENLWTAWWAWFSFAMILGILEVVVPGYIFLGFAVGALVMAVLMLIGISGLTLPLSLVIFAVLSLVAFVLMRQYFKLDRGQVKKWDTDINE